MRKRILLIAVPLVIVAIAASVAVASPSDAEHSRGPRLDRLHAERPIAASDSTATDSVTDAAKTATLVQAYVRALQIDEYLQGNAANKMLTTFTERHAKKMKIESHPELLMRINLVPPRSASDIPISGKGS